MMSWPLDSTLLYMSLQVQWSRIEITVNVGEGSSCRIDSTSRCNRNPSVRAVHVRAGAVMLSEQYMYVQMRCYRTNGTCTCRCTAAAGVVIAYAYAGPLQ
jgi:hypothetical protein